MDTDSNYIAIPGDQLEDIVRTELKAKRKIGFHGKTGADIRRGCLNSNVKEAGWLNYVRSATFLINKTGKKWLARRACSKDRVT